MTTLTEIEAAAEIVYRFMQPTAQICWPLLSQRAGCEVWVKHENHTPIGAFKIRGGLVYMDELRRTHPQVRGLIAATRGNHGQSVATAARHCDLEPILVVPHGNSVEKNAAMQAQGAELIVHGHDFQDSYEHAQELAGARGLYMVPSFDVHLVRGVATYALEFLRGVDDLDTVYVPIGRGSGICGMIAARDGLGLSTKIVGVCAANAPCYALSFAQGQPVETASADTMADGVACRTPAADPLEIILKGADRIVTVSEEEIMAAMRNFYTDTHNVAEGAGAAPLAALLGDRTRNVVPSTARAGLVLSGGNVDRDVYRDVLIDKG